MNDKEPTTMNDKWHQQCCWPIHCQTKIDDHIHEQVPIYRYILHLDNTNTQGWYWEYISLLLELGYTVFIDDPCLLFKVKSDEDGIIACVTTDDTALSHSDNAVGYGYVQELRDAMTARGWEHTFQPRLQDTLGMVLTTQSDKSLLLTMPAKINKKNFLRRCRPINHSHRIQSAHVAMESRSFTCITANRSYNVPRRSWTLSLRRQHPPRHSHQCQHPVLRHARPIRIRLCFLQTHRGVSHHHHLNRSLLPLLPQRQ